MYRGGTGAIRKDDHRATFLVPILDCDVVVGDSVSLDEILSVGELCLGSGSRGGGSVLGDGDELEECLLGRVLRAVWTESLEVNLGKVVNTNHKLEGKAVPEHTPSGL